MTKQSDIPKNEIEIDVQPEPSCIPPDGCPRCQGLLVQTFLEVDLLGDSGSRLPPAWRCVNCGILLDLQVLENRALDSGQSPLSVPSSPQLKSRTPRGGPRLHFHLNSKGGRSSPS